MIYVIGDSHSSVFSGKGVATPGEFPYGKDNYMVFQWKDEYGKNELSKLPHTEYFTPIRIGPKIAYTLYSKKELIENIVNIAVSDMNKDYVFFFFGEIDIRAHFKIQAKSQNKSIEDISKECINNYLRLPIELKNKGYQIGIFSPHASMPDKLAPNYEYYGGGKYDSTCIERNEITKVFNGILKKECSENNLYNVSIFEEMLLEDGSTDPVYIMDWIHMSQTAMPLIIKKFKEIKLI